jgi:hypothetical protein
MVLVCSTPPISALQEWNGKREITEKTFKFSDPVSTRSIFWTVVTFVGVYSVVSWEQVR